MSSVLSYLAPRLTSQHENLATEALGYLLRSSLEALDVLQVILKDGLGGSQKISRITNQYTAGEESRPDIAGFGEDEKLLFLIEAKFWAGLTDSQPNEYLRRLEEAGGKALVFLVPELRMPSIQRELSDRVSEKERSPLKWEKVGSGFVAKNKLGSILHVTSWASLLNSLEGAIAREGNTQAMSDLTQIKSLVSLFESEGFIPMTAESVTETETPRKILMLNDLCKKMLEKTKDLGLVSFGNLQKTSYETGSGRYVLMKKAGCWIGTNFSSWKKHQVSPLWVEFSESDFGKASEVRRAFDQLKHRNGLFEGDSGQVLVPLKILPNSSEAEVVDHLILQIQEMRHLLEVSQMADYVFKDKKNSA